MKWFLCVLERLLKNNYLNWAWNECVCDWIGRLKCFVGLQLGHVDAVILWDFSRQLIGPHVDRQWWQCHIVRSSQAQNKLLHMMHIDAIVKVNDVTTIVVRSQNFAINIALCLRLSTICGHNIFEFGRQVSCTGKYINGAHNQLVQMTILHEINAMQNRILECSPNLLQILIGL